MSLFNTLTLTVSRRRGVSGGYVNGRWVDGTPTSLTIRGSWQPANGKEVEDFEDGRRQNGIYKIYTSSKLYVPEQGDPEDGRCDLIIKDGINYEVLKEEIWENRIISHNKYFVSRILD